MKHAKVKFLSTLFAVTVLLGACAQLPQPEAQNEVQKPEAQGAAGDVIPGQYIVALQKPGQTTGLGTQGVGALEPASVAASLGVQSIGTLGVINGFVAVGVDEAALSRLETDARVRYAEPDRIIKLDRVQNQGLLGQSLLGQSLPGQSLQIQTKRKVQKRPIWGLDRIDQRNLPLSRSYRYRATGRGVTAYVIDSGIRGGSEFGKRLGGGVSSIDDGNGYNDCYGHGTHVAGTLGGKTYGVAKGVELIAVRVFDCNGGSSNSALITGIDWVNFNHESPAVVNMSLESSPPSPAIDEAVAALVKEKVTVVVAAGNKGSDACGLSPARIPAVLTVGASNQKDNLWEDSNRGRCVDVFAPGDRIISAGLQGTLTLSGTSMATPHAAGVAALILEKNRGASPAGVIKTIVGRTTSGKFGNTSGAPDRLLYSGF